MEGWLEGNIVITPEQEAECAEMTDQVNEVNEDLKKKDFIEDRALNVMQEMLEMQQRLDADNAGVTIKVKVPPRQPEAIMQEAEQLQARFVELQEEFNLWQAMQPVETAH